jgi:tetratricopeptide (TPR) repeat protein
VLSEAVEAGKAAGEHGMAADASVALTYLRLHTDPESSHAKVRAALDAAISVFEEIDDEAGLARALSIAGMLRLWRGEAANAIEELERAARLAHDAGDRPQEIQDLQFVLIATLVGPVPVAAALERVDEIRRRADGIARLEVTCLRTRGHLEAMQGRFDTARVQIAEAKALAEELGFGTAAEGALQGTGEIELLAGDLPAAERALRASCEILERRGDWGHFASVAPLLADALHAQGRGGEAAQTIELAAGWSLDDDVEAQMSLRRVRANLLAHQGDLKEAERLAREAVELGARTDYLNGHANALTSLAGILELAGKREQAAAAMEQALALYDRKGNLVMAERTRERLTDLRKQVTS